MKPSTLVTAPHKTFSGSRRPSSYKTSASSPLSSEFSESFTTFNVQDTRPLMTPQSPVEYRAYFSPAQLSPIRALCSQTQLFDFSFLSIEKYPACHHAKDMYDLEMTTLGLSIELAANNTTTRNFNRLLSRLLECLEQTTQQKSKDVVSIETYNALFLTRVFMKHFTDNLTNKEIIDHVEEQTESTKAKELLGLMLSVLLNMNTQNRESHEFYLEILTSFLALFSTQLRHPLTLGESNYFLDVFLSEFVSRAEAVVARLLENVIARVPAMASASVVYTAYSYIFSTPMPAEDLLPDLSLLLLNLLGAQSEHSHWLLAFKQAMASLSDHHVISATEIDESNQKMHLISFKSLLDMLSESAWVEEKVMLFYRILSENESFRVYVLSRTDQETIYLPILKLIYESMETKTNYPQLYLLMTVLLILSQDEVNNDAIQKITVYNVAWFTERPLLKSISLGGLMVLVMFRTLQLNLSQHRDIYLHTNCLAILANMSSTLLDMHAYTAQRIISLFELLAKRYIKLADRKEFGEDREVYEDVLMFMLEIMQSILSHRLKQNLQLVYALLLKRELLIPFYTHPRLADTANALDQVIQYFNTRVFEANLKAPSSHEVLGLIEDASRTWSNQKMKSLPHLRFQYEQEPNAAEFFIPYVWTLILRKNYIYWNKDKCHVLDQFFVLAEESESTTVQ